MFLLMGKTLYTLLFLILTCGFHSHSLEGWIYEDISSIPSDDRICSIEIPDAFSPNGDGINDSFRITSSCRFENFSLQIFNDSKQLVLAQDNIYSAWDGTIGGVPAPEGKYECVIIYRTKESLDKEKRGELLLLR